MKFSDEELNILLDGTEDTKDKIREKELPESYEYKTKVEVLNKRIKRELSDRHRKYAKSQQNEQSIYQEAEDNAKSLGKEEMDRLKKRPDALSIKEVKKDE